MSSRNLLILYVDPVPLPLQRIVHEIPGQIIKQCLVTSYLKVDAVGKIQCWIENGEKTEEFAGDILAKIRKAAGQVSIIAIGKMDQKDKLSIFVSSLKYVTSVLAREIELIIRDLGLSSEKTQELSQLVANEILCNLAIRNDLTTGSPLLNEIREFSGWFVLNEKLKRQMVDTYVKTIDQYSTALTTRSSLLRRLTSKLGDRKNEIVTTIIVGLIAEACVRILIYVATMAHRMGREQDIERFGLPSPIISKIKSQENLTASEVAIVLDVEEWAAIVQLNSLKQLGAVSLLDAEERTWKGTGRKTFPEFGGAAVLRRGQDVVGSKEFHDAFSARFVDDRDFDWKPDRDTQDLVDLIIQKCSVGSQLSK